MCCLLIAGSGKHLLFKLHFLDPISSSHRYLRQHTLHVNAASWVIFTWGRLESGCHPLTAACSLPLCSWQHALSLPSMSLAESVDRYMRLRETDGKLPGQFFHRLFYWALSVALHNGNGHKKAARRLRAPLPTGFCLNTCWSASSGWLALSPLNPPRIATRLSSAPSSYSYLLSLSLFSFSTRGLLNKLNFGLLTNWRL